MGCAQLTVCWLLQRNILNPVARTTAIFARRINDKTKDKLGET